MSDWRKFGAATATGLCALLCAGSLGAYTIITRDGHRLEVKSRPEVREGQAFVRLMPHGQLAVLRQDKIDWARTDAANPGAPGGEAPAIAVTSDEKLVQSTPATESAPSKPREIKIMGGAAPKETAPTKPATAVAEGSQAQKDVNKQEAIIKLQKEYADLAGVRETTLQQKHTHETELAELQAKQTVNAGGDNPEAKRIRELQDLISQANDQLNKLEIRMNDIRSEAVQLGGSID
jgi:hypothetical protein